MYNEVNIEYFVFCAFGKKCGVQLPLCALIQNARLGPVTAIFSRFRVIVANRLTLHMNQYSLILGNC